MVRSALRRQSRSTVRTGVRILLGLAVPSLLYYGLRAVGTTIYVALVVSTVVSALPAVYSLIRHRRVDGLSTYFSAMMLGGLVVALVPGSTRFLLAREAILTAVTGFWFVVSIWSRRPLTYLFTRPVLEGRLRWPEQWDELWSTSSRFRRMWRVSSLLWGVGLIADAAVRVVLAYTLRPDLVPALGLVLYVGTAIGLNAVVTIYYTLCRVHDPRSSLRRGDASRSIAEVVLDRSI